MNTTTSTAPDAAEHTAKNDGTPKLGKRRMARVPKEETQPSGDKPAAPPKPPGGKAATRPAANEPRGPSKIASVIALLERSEGATLAEMVEATGWLPHTTRAALTGLKKKGQVVTKDKRGDVTCYHIAASA